MKPLTRYVLLQIPGWALAVPAVLLVLSWGWINATAAGLVIMLWLAKDILLYPLYRSALRVDSAGSSGVEVMVGRVGHCRTEVNGRGMIEVQGERWLARSANQTRIAPGLRVQVVGYDGLVLQVLAVDRPSAGKT